MSNVFTAPPVASGPLGHRRQRPRRAVVGGLLAVSVLASLAGPIGDAAAQSTSKVVVAMNFSPASLNPTVGNIGWNDMQMGMGETLVRVTRAGGVEPWLATGYRQLNRRTTDVDVRRGVTFSDGRKLDAAAVAASLKDSVAKLPAAASVLDLADAVALDADTVRITTNEPNGALWNNLAHFSLVIHDTTQSADELASRPNLTGPFMVDTFRKDVSLALKKNPRYWSTPAKVDQVEVRFLVDANTRTSALLAGDVDLAYQVPVQAVDAIKKAGLTVKSVTTGYLYFILVNTAKPQFSDARVRRALALAINRQELADKVMLGTATPADGAIAALFPFGLRDGGTDVDVAQANSLLSQAGWDRSGSGTREKDGVKLSAVLLTYPGRPDLTPLAVAIQSAWKAIGVDVDIRSTNDINGELGRGFDLAMYAQNTAPTADPGAFLDAHFRPGGTNNWTKYASATVIKQLDDLAGTADPKVRYPKAKVIQTMVRDDAPEIPLLLPKFNIGLSKRLASYDPFPSDYYVVTNELRIS